MSATARPDLATGLANTAGTHTGKSTHAAGVAFGARVTSSPAATAPLVPVAATTLDPAAATPLDRAGIAARIPHTGSMCLLDAVLDWNPETIRCRATSHRDTANPLAAAGRLGIACGIEYAAQAMAVHGALLAAGGDKPRQGYLASVRGVDFHAERLDDIAGELDIEAERLSGDDNNVLYRFTVRGDGRLLLEGRAAVILDSEG